MNFTVVHSLAIFTLHFVKERLELPVAQPTWPNKLNALTSVMICLNPRAFPLGFVEG
jgi:hypothetical protein